MLKWYVPVLLAILFEVVCKGVSEGDMPPEMFKNFENLTLNGAIW